MRKPWIAAVLFTACQGSSPAPPPASAPVPAPSVGVASIEPSWLIPKLDGATSPWAVDGGRRRFLLSGLRVVVDRDGGVERATERFPVGDVDAVPLPARLGGGFLFYQADSQGTVLWRADSWVGTLRPLSKVGPLATDVVPGFDRLYLRTRANRLIAMDAEDGTILPRGPLPAATALGAMVFADGWRAVVDTDLRGPLATFDAGASWHALPVRQRVLSATIRRGDPTLFVGDGSYRLDAKGQLQLVRYEAMDEEDRQEAAAAGGAWWGDAPLRPAIEHGWPLDARHAVVLHEGAIARVELPEGMVEAVRPDAIDDPLAQCTGVRYGAGFGFVCGVEDGATSIHRFVPPLDLAPVATFEEPRFVSPSGSGALVVRGPCTSGDGDDETQLYCVLRPGDEPREIAVRGELGSERVVALKDGRVVVLVPPRLGRPGRVTVIAGSDLKTRELTYDDQPARAVEIARSGMWLEGIREAGEGKLAGWVEAGGPVVGLAVDVDRGTVVLGEPYEEGGDVFTVGEFAFAVTPVGVAYESIDGGENWRTLQLPTVATELGRGTTRGCTRVGCLLPGWTRVGWGPSQVEDDLKQVTVPDVTQVVRPVLRPSLSLRCDLSGEPPERQTASGTGRGESPFSSWMGFRGEPPPNLDKDVLGVDKAAVQGNGAASHVYVWGPKGADWSKVGSWQIRFDDVFRADGVVRSGITRSPWPDEITAAESIGVRHNQGYWRWESVADPGGRAALANLCMGSRCLAYTVVDGEPIVHLRALSAEPSYRRPLEDGVVHLGESWFFLTSHQDAVHLWRGRLGIMEPLAQLRRLDHNRYPVSPVRLVRRSLGRALGLLVTSVGDPANGHSVGRWTVLPIDPESGLLGEPIDLGMSDLEGELPRVCEPGDDGWLVTTSMPRSPRIETPGTRGTLDTVELRLRLQASDHCVESIAARASSSMNGAPGRAEGGVPLIARERYSGRRWTFRCTPRGGG